MSGNNLLVLETSKCFGGMCPGLSKVEGLHGKTESNPQNRSPGKKLAQGFCPTQSRHKVTVSLARPSEVNRTRQGATQA